MKHAYPRDLIGYGQYPPHPKWPNKARIAVQFVLNYEEGGENCVLHGDQQSETFLSEIIGAQAYTNRHLSVTICSHIFISNFFKCFSQHSKFNWMKCITIIYV